MFVKKGDCCTVAEVVARNTGIPANEFLTEQRTPHLQNLQEAVAFVKSFMKAHPDLTISIVGDYDADGINATAILYWCFAKAGANIRLRIPYRFSEGYGLSEKIIDELPPGLLITVDNGIASIAAVKKAKERGMKVIIIDHHLPPADLSGTMMLPEADIILNPHTEDQSEFSDYCGAGLAYRFASAMFGARFPELLVLASIATVADSVPLVGANRTLVRDGLRYINAGRSVPGLKVLLENMNLTEHISENDYGFRLAPICNAAGRLYDNGAKSVLALLCAKNNDVRSSLRAEKLIEINQDRKKRVKNGRYIAEQIVNPNQRPIVIYHPSFEEGIIGIIAGQLAEAYHCPVVVFADDRHSPGILKGSGRSIPDIHLKAVLDKIQCEMVGYGGHAAAAGISICRDHLAQFSQAFQKAVGTTPDIPKDKLYDLELNLSPKHLEAVCNELDTFAPYGEGNPGPIFHLASVTVNDWKRIGDGAHLMIRRPEITLMGFGLADKYENMGFPKQIECIGYLSESWFRGQKSYKFEIIDFV